MNWSDYCAWRRTKCPSYPRDRAGWDSVCDSEVFQNALWDWRRSEEQVHAVLEFLGELAELGLVLLTQGLGGPDSRSRDRIIDECGDVYFCGCWVLDAFFSRVLDSYPKLEFLNQADENVISGHGDSAQLQRTLVEACCCAGLLANRMKKRRYHGVDFDTYDDVNYVIKVFVAVNLVLLRLGSSVEEALRANKEKLERRYPDGYVSGGGLR